MVRLRPELFFRFILLTGFISIVFIGFFTVRHQTKQELRFDARAKEQFLTVMNSKNAIEISFHPQDTVRLSDSSISIYLFWSPWSDKSIEMLQYVDRKVSVIDSVEFELIALSVKESREAVLEVISEIEPTLQQTVHWLEGTQIYGELAVPGIPTLIIVGVDSSVIESFVGVNNQEFEEWISASFFN